MGHDDQYLTARALFMEENTDGEFDLYDKKIVVFKI